MIDPASFPVDFGLKSCEPGVAQDYFVFSQVGQEELKCGLLGSSLDLQVCEELELSTFVWGAIDIKEFSWFLEALDRHVEVFCVF
jgi:hypothetical protein